MKANYRKTGAWTSGQVYFFALICLILGGVAGYLVRGPATLSSSDSSLNQPSSLSAATPQQRGASPETLKYMADKQAEPLLAELKARPRDPELLARIGNIYYDSRNYTEAIDYYNRSISVRDDAGVRSDMGSAYWYVGDGDAAIREFERALKLDPKHPNALFNLGMVRWQSRMDAAGAVAAWQQLLKSNPNLPRRLEVEQLIARAKQHMGLKPAANVPASAK